MTTNYVYGNSDWADLLTSYDGHTISYSGGNPTNWYNGETYSNLTWEQGRRLSSTTKGTGSDVTSISYTYDMSGIRSSKTVSGVTHNYVTQSGRVVRESYDNKVLDFFYDANGRPFSLKYSTNSGAYFTKYYYVLNAQGDVVGLTNSSGALIAKYAYDAWGKLLSVTDTSGTEIVAEDHIANINPLRYRGYYWEADTEWYYLQSRYYDPIVKRFLNADTYSSTGTGFLGCNMFAYCENNPVSNQDPTGKILITTLISIGAAVVGAGVAVYTGVKAREAGCGWGETILHSLMNGLMAYCTVYTFGMSAYGCYQDFCRLHGMTPITEIGGKTASAATIPQEAYDTYNYAQSHNGAAQNGYKGNKTFANDGRDGSQILPNSYAPFREYDIYPKTPGMDRGAERIVIGAGSGGAAWYTPNHYRTFIRMEIK